MYIKGPLRNAGDIAAHFRRPLWAPEPPEEALRREDMSHLGGK